MNYVLLLINVLMLVLGQIMWKIGMSKVELKVSFQGIINVLFNPYILGGGVVYVFATVIWLYLLSKEELSRIYPLQSLCYVVGALFGVVLFKESITMQKIFGIIMILGGAILMAAK